MGITGFAVFCSEHYTNIFIQNYDFRRNDCVANVELSVPRITVVSSATTTTLFSASPSETLDSSDASSSSHGNSKEGATIGAPIATLSAIVVLLVALLIRHRHRRRTQSTMADVLSELANNSSSAKNPVEQQRWELPAGIAATEMEGQTEIAELVA